MSSVFGKNGNEFLAQSRAALFLPPPSFDHMPESQEASELFVGLSHISGLTLRCLVTVKLFVFDLF